MKARYTVLLIWMIVSIALINVALGVQLNISQLNSTQSNNSIVYQVLNKLINPNFVGAEYILWFGGFILYCNRFYEMASKMGFWSNDSSIWSDVIVILLIFVSVIGIANESLTALIGILATFGGYLAGNKQGQQPPTPPEGQ